MARVYTSSVIGAPAAKVWQRIRDFNGLPVISLPCGFTEDGLPIGFQIQGKSFAEAQVLQTAYAYEQAHPAIRERKCGLWK